MNTCLKGNHKCNSRNQSINSDHKSQCCGRYYCNLDCYFNSYHVCNKCGIRKHVCEFKEINQNFFNGTCFDCFERICTFNRKCFRCQRNREFNKEVGCDKCWYHYCSSYCYEKDLWNCPKCGKKLHRCQFLKTGNCKFCK